MGHLGIIYTFLHANLHFFKAQFQFALPEAQILVLRGLTSQGEELAVIRYPTCTATIKINLRVSLILLHKAVHK
jgi:hypothetical protein